MCLIVFSWKQHPDYQLIVAANRDEFYARPTLQSHIWETDPPVIAGKDLQAKGTWIGITTTQRFAALTNYRDLANLKAEAPSRGELTTNFLLGNDSAREYLEKLQVSAKSYNGFNLLVGTAEELYYFSNYEHKIRKLEAGLYGLSNHLLDTDWFKVRRAKEKFAKTIQTNFTSNDLFEMMQDSNEAQNDQVQQTGLSQEKEKMLSSMFIQSPQYGTCCSTVITSKPNKQINFWERNHNPLSIDKNDRFFVT